ncbi:MAG TPA: hypothetical protein VH253_17920 [Phycisphaerae bacterium]|nr:hypothetical protein [Phycisphaerae bacterium]
MTRRTEGAEGAERGLKEVGAGMLGVSQKAATLALAPVFGWAVAYDELLPEEPVRRRFWRRARERGMG